MACGRGQQSAGSGDDGGFKRLLPSRAYILARTSRSPIPKRSAVCLRELMGVVTDFALETAVNRMIENSAVPGTYGESAAIWENDIKGLCSMIQDYITQDLP